MRIGSPNGFLGLFGEGAAAMGCFEAGAEEEPDFRCAAATTDVYFFFASIDDASTEAPFFDAPAFAPEGTPFQCSVMSPRTTLKDRVVLAKSTEVEVLKVRSLAFTIEQKSVSLTGRVDGRYEGVVFTVAEGVASGRISIASAGVSSVLSTGASSMPAAFPAYVCEVPVQ